MPQRHPPVGGMTAVAKDFSVVAFLAVSRFALCIQTMRILIIKVVYAAIKIVPSMTIEAKALVTMATGAPRPIRRCPVAMLVPPVA